jgi:hypothetical protein
MKKILLVVVTLYIGKASYAADPSTCKIEAVAKCICKYSMKVSCDNGQIGYIANDEKLTSVTLRLIDESGASKNIKLSNPPGGVREYYGAQYNNWVKLELEKKGMNYKDIFVDSFTTASKTELFADINGEVPLLGISEKIKEGLDCSIISDPFLIIGGPSCGNQKICLMKVKCSEYKNGVVVKNTGETDAVCKAINGTCPSATFCVNDEDVRMERASSIGKTTTLDLSEKKGGVQ